MTSHKFKDELIRLISLEKMIASQAQEPPAQCRGPPPPVANPHECCPIPSIFKDEEFEKCGFVKLEGANGPPAPRQGPPDCVKQLCILKNQNLLKDEDAIDTDALIAFIDKWAAENPSFEPVVGHVKERCIGKELPGPPEICEANKLLFCLSTTFYMECPIWVENDGCSKLKSHIEECKPYFLH
ncbi:General odorant-binding protein 67 [Eumeta japonica]|uniref:General odorant-binding protein 67 n=1 Tax=Eumeta variegata TaxID=151549 RepID=A0A4C1TYX7_EUMVA|nr:General odorant-binding protein 67 [Eumeta japonica]